MDLKSITSKKSFIKTFKREYLTSSSKRFYLILLSVILGLFPFFINKIIYAESTNYKSNYKDIFLKKIKLKYLNRQKDVPMRQYLKPPLILNDEQIAKRMESRKKQRELSVLSRPSDDAEENSILLSDDSSLDDVLDNVLSVNNRIKESRGVVFVDNFNKSIDTKRVGEIVLDRKPVERKAVVRTWSSEEINDIEKAVKQNERTIYLCYQKFKDELMGKKGSITVRFEISPLGKIIKKSVKLLDTQIKNKEFLDCIIRRVKYFRGFNKAKHSEAKNYIFEKKWFF